MDDQDLLRDLARAALDEEREEHARWERWDRLNDGALTSEEEAALQALAATSPEAEQAYEAFRPLDPAFRARVVAAITPLVAAVEPAEAVAPSIREDRPPPIRERRRSLRSRFLGWRAALAGSGLAAAAALFLILRLPAALPAYQLAEVVSGVTDVRADDVEPDPVPKLTAGAAFTAVAHADAKLAGSVRLQTSCFVAPPRPVARRIRQLAKCSLAKQGSKGSVVAGTIDRDLPPGPATLWIALAYPGNLPSAETIEKLPPAAPTQRHSWVAMPKPIEIRAP